MINLSIKLNIFVELFQVKRIYVIEFQSTFYACSSLNRTRELYGTKILKIRHNVLNQTQNF
jgi:hypothetical protein